MKISTIIPSRLHPLPGAQPEALWLDRALLSVRGQTVCEQVELEIVVGLDPGVKLPERFLNIAVAQGRVADQAAVVNAAVAASSGDVLAFLEDDDVWRPRRLEYGLRCLKDFDVVTTNQSEFHNGLFFRINDFPTPSGWLMPRAVWDRLGPMDESIPYHVDTEYLGRMIAARLRRAHLVERDAPDGPSRPWLQNVARYSAIGRTAERDPLVDRTVNTSGRMSEIARDEAARSRSADAHRRMFEKFGLIPW
jgi:hypothetical protein